MIVTDTWFTTIAKALFTLFMLAMMVWCTGCVPRRDPVDANRAIVVRQDPKAMAERVETVNRMLDERGGR